jgi:two-component system, NarL family, sensor histidine kinase UhpB
MQAPSSSDAPSRSAELAAPPARAAAGSPPPAPDRVVRTGASLLWRVFAVNAAVFVTAFALLAWAPVTVHRVARPSELVILAIGLIVMLIVDLLLLRRALGPLRRLASVMGEVTPGAPGRRAQREAGAGREVHALAGALNAMLDRLEGERRESSRRALAAQEAERKRIALELHDEVGQTLTAIALRAERAAGDPASQPDALAEIAEQVLRSLEDVHRIGRELRPEALDDLGLVNALIALCSRLDRPGSLRVRRELEWDLPALSAERELVIYRVAQEALTNVLRHAQASQVTVSLRATAGEVVLEVRDDGRGLPVHVREGGLTGMRERAMLIGAELVLATEPAHGTAIILRVPHDEA